MEKEQFELLTQEEKSLYMFISDNVHDTFANEITKEELVKLLFNNLKFKNNVN